MKKLFFAVPFAALLAGCLKNEGTTTCTYDECAAKAPAAEINDLKAYLSSNGITAEQHCSGVFYVIDQQGTGTKAGACNEVLVNYKGQFTNGQIFDSSKANQPAALPLDGVVTGFRNGLMQLRPGGKMRLFIPPSLGYGNRQSGTIPPNSILVFNVELLSVR